MPQPYSWWLSSLNVACFLFDHQQHIQNSFWHNLLSPLHLVNTTHVSDYSLDVILLMEIPHCHCLLKLYLWSLFCVPMSTLFFHHCELYLWHCIVIPSLSHSHTKLEALWEQEPSPLYPYLYLQQLLWQLQWIIVKWSSKCIELKEISKCGMNYSLILLNYR